MNPMISEFTVAADKAISHLKSEFAKMQIGTASAALLDGVLVEVYGSMQPVMNVATISVPEPRVIKAQPWDKSNLKAIETAIIKSDLGINPVNNGEAIILNIPVLNEERRLELVKVAKKLAEETKITVRQARQDAHSAFKKAEQDGDMTEDDRRGSEKKLQEVVDKKNVEIEELVSLKEAQIMKV